jgi:hypothetical protein
MMASRGMFGEPRGRRRRQAFWRVFRFLFAIAAVLAVCSYGYQVGVSASQARTDQLEADLVGFQRANLDLRDQITLARQQSDEAKAALASMRQRYAAEVPTGPAAELLGQLRAQLGAGIEADRLAFLIEVAGSEGACQSEPETKRFMPRTPISTGPLSYVRFADRITITGAGESARSETGLPEAWFDPAKPIRLEFRTIDGATTSVEGIVPFTHQMVFDGTEYRFSAVGSEPRFVEMTAQACPLPRLGPDDPTVNAQGGDDGEMAGPRRYPTVN